MLTGSPSPTETREPLYPFNGIQYLVFRAWVATPVGGLILTSGLCHP
jgi:hypothetical protein